MRHSPTRHALDALLGHWSTTGESIATAQEPALSIRGSDRYEWLPGRKFLVHYADVWMGEEKVDVIELIGPCGEALEGIPMQAFDNGGNQTAMHLSQESANVWRFGNEQLRTRLTLHEGGGSMAAHWERKDAAGRWGPWLNMRFVRTT
jgi:hypothetical protein